MVGRCWTIHLHFLSLHTEMMDGTGGVLWGTQREVADEDRRSLRPEKTGAQTVRMGTGSVAGMRVGGWRKLVAAATTSPVEGEDGTITTTLAK